MAKDAKALLLSLSEKLNKLAEINQTLQTELKKSQTNNKELESFIAANKINRDSQVSVSFQDTKEVAELKTLLSETKEMVGEKLDAMKVSDDITKLSAAIGEKLDQLSTGADIKFLTESLTETMEQSSAAHEIGQLQEVLAAKIEALVNWTKTFKVDMPQSEMPKLIPYLTELTQSVERFKFPTAARDAIPVRLSDGKEFYKALYQIFGGPGGGSVPRYSGKDGGDYVPTISTLSLPQFDYVEMALSAGDTTETYTFKKGGSSGTLVATVVIVYTSSGRTVISTVTKTPTT